MVHREGTGSLTADAIERRARELARIEHSREVTAQHREQATLELRGETLPDTIEEDADGKIGVSRDPSDPVTDRGGRTPEAEGDNEESAEERLALEGVDEAQHEQMLADRRRNPDRV